ncbi:MAG TPA: sigma-54 dependent transcriptional regulator [Terrimicrobiaceae bacterium]
MLGLEADCEREKDGSFDPHRPRNSSEDRLPVRVAIVCAPGTSAAAETVEALLREAPGFTCGRYGYEFASEIKFLEPVPRVVFDPDVVVITFHAIQADELEGLFARLSRIFPARPVLVIPTALESFDVLEILEMGASDFLLPPLRRSELFPRVIRQALLTRRTRLEKFTRHPGLKEIIGEGPALLQQLRRVPRFARCDATVLISGESGTGKEIFARAIHSLSPRAKLPFVPVNCGAIPEHLIESEIFGHKRGAFTGAVSDRQGLIHESEGGTLFLDEVDSLTCHAQVKLLRFLQEGEYRPVGSQKMIHANVRVVAAANANFDQIVQEGKFREDLFYRLNVLQLTLPPLRERRADIPLLVRHFLDQQASLTNEPPKRLSPAALNRVLSYSWPGNVRELQNVLTRAYLLSDHPAIQVFDLSLPDADRATEDGSFQSMKSQVVERFEREFLEAVLRVHDGNITHAARSVKKNRRAFWELLRKHDLLRGSSRTPE